MRVFVPATSLSLRELLEEGALPASPEVPLTAFAVTPGLRDWYADDSDDEELEYAALGEAARASLRLLDLRAAAARRRVVVAADVASADIEVRDDLERGVVRVSAPIPMARVASVHLDDADAQPVVAAAAAAIVAADLGDADSQERVDDAEGFELSWFANQEIERVLAEL